MRILHTSDVHLSERHPETLSALTEILDVARSHSVDLLTIGGDLFESEGDAEALRPRLRETLSGNGFPIVAIPGNHDCDAFEGNLDFGSDIEILTKRPVDTFTLHDLTLVGVPYVAHASEDLYSRLREAGGESDPKALLLHCTLDIGYTSGDFGEEESLSYFPVSAATLSSLGFDYVLAGHFHRQTEIRELDEGVFIYPGSPVSHTTRETGRRQAVLIDTDGGTPQAIQLPTYYHDSMDLFVYPGREMETIRTAKEWLDSRAGDNCELEMCVRGHIKMDETQFGRRLESLSDHLSIAKEYRTVAKLFEHPLFQRFQQKLEEKEDLDDARQLESVTMDVMSRMLAEGKLGL